MDIVRHVSTGYPVIRPEFTRLDASNAGRLKELCAKSARGKRLLLDFNHLELVDSTGLGGLVAVLKNLGPEGEVGIVSNTPGLLVVLRITRLNTIFRVFASESEGVAWLEAFPAADSGA